MLSKPLSLTLVLLERVGSGPLPARGLRAVQIGPVNVGVDEVWGIRVVGTTGLGTVVVGTADFGTVVVGEVYGTGGATAMSGIGSSV